MIDGVRMVVLQSTHRSRVRPNIFKASHHRSVNFHNKNYNPKEDPNYIRSGWARNQPPIKTVGKPTVTLPPCDEMSPIRAAGMPPTITVALPIIMLSGGPTHVHMSPIRACAIIPVNTVKHPSVTGPPTCGTRAVNIGQT